MSEYLVRVFAEENQRLRDRIAELEQQLEEADKWSMFNLPVGTKILINNLCGKTEKRKKTKVFDRRKNLLTSKRK